MREREEQQGFYNLSITETLNQSLKIQEHTSSTETLKSTLQPQIDLCLFVNRTGKKTTLCYQDKSILMPAVPISYARDMKEKEGKKNKKETKCKMMNQTPLIPLPCQLYASWFLINKTSHPSKSFCLLPDRCPLFPVSWYVIQSCRLSTGLIFHMKLLPKGREMR